MSQIDGPPSPEGQWYSISQVAKSTPYSATFVRQLARQGKIDAIKIGRDWLTTQQSVLQYIQAQQERHKKALTILQTAERAFLVLTLVLIVFSTTPKVDAQGPNTLPYSPGTTVEPVLNNVTAGWQGLASFYSQELTTIFNLNASSLAEQAAQARLALAVWHQFGSFYGQRLSDVYRVNASALAEQANQIKIALLWQRQETSSVLVSVGQAMLGKTPEEYLADAAGPDFAVGTHTMHSRGSLRSVAASALSEAGLQQPRVLGLSTGPTSAPAAKHSSSPNSGVSETQVQGLIDQILQRDIASGAFTGPKGPQGPPGPSSSSVAENGNGETTAIIGGNPIVTYVPPVPATSFSGASLAGFTDLSAGSFTSGDASINGNLSVSGAVGAAGAMTAGSLTSSGNATIDGALSAATSTLASLTVSGPATFTGSTTIVGLTVTGFNPGLTQGSIAFQGASGLVQDNLNLFYDSADHRLGLGTTTPSQLLTVAGNGLFTGQLAVTGPAAFGTTTIVNLTLGTALPVSGGGTNSTSSPSAGAIAYGTGTAYAFSAAGTANQVLASGGVGVPAFVNISSLISQGSNIVVSGTSTIAVVSSPSFAGITVSGTSSLAALTTTGNVGIGTTSPGNLLTMQGGSSTASLLNIASSTGNSVLFIGNNGNVGIGTTSPATALDVGGGQFNVRNAGPLYTQGLTARLNTTYLPTESAPSALNYNEYDAFGITSVFPDGNFIIAYRGGPNHAGVGSNGVIKIQTSTDQGMTWSAPTTILSDPGLDLRGIGGGVTPNGRLVLFYTVYNGSTFLSIYYIYSEDEGVTWSVPVAISTGSNTVFVTYGGLISIGGGQVLTTWYGNDSSGNYTTYVIKSSDNGKTWGSAIPVITSTTNQYTEGSFAYLGGSKIVGIVRVNNAEMEQVISSDNGSTWTDQGAITWDKPIGTGGFNAWLSTYMAPSGKRVVVAYFQDRHISQIRAIYSYAADVINGTSGWETNSLVTVGSLLSSGSGYVSVVHPYDSPAGFGWYYNELSSTDTAITFFTTPINNSIPLNTTFEANVGIGNSAPSYLLDVLPASGYAGNLFRVASSTGSTGMVITSQGNVGIGTTSPSQLLTVGNNNQFTVSSSGNASTTAFTDSGNAYFPNLGAQSCIGTTAAGLLQAGSCTGGSSGGLGTTSPFSAGYIPEATGTNVSLSNSNIFQTLQGNVGIGTTNPGNALQVYNASAAQALFNGYSTVAGTASPNSGSILIGGNASYQGIIDYDQTGATTMTIKNSYSSATSLLNFNTGYGGNRTAMSIQGSGNVGIGTSTPAYTLAVQGTGGVNPFQISSSTGSSLMVIQKSGNVGIGTTSPQYLLQAGNSSVSGIVARFQNANGTCDINPTTNTLACSSDERLKKNITPITDDLNQVLALQPVYFNWNAESTGTPEHPGFIAQQVQAVMPDVVSTDPNTGLMSIGYSDLVPAMVSAMQQMQMEITTLQGGLNGNASTSNLTVYDPSNFSADSVGEAEIPPGQTSVRVNFSQQYVYQPIVTFSPEGSFVPAFISEKDDAGFTLSLVAATTAPTTFDWHSFASPSEQLTVSGGTTQPIALVVAGQSPPNSSGSGQATIVPAAGDQGASSSPSSGQVLADSTTTPDSSASTTPDSSGISTPDANANANTSSSPPSSDQSSGTQAPTPPPSDAGANPSLPATVAPITQPTLAPSTSSATGDDSSSETASPPSSAATAGGSAMSPPSSTAATPTTGPAGSTSP
jgi:hypothetical protein